MARRSLNRRAAKVVLRDWAFACSSATFASILALSALASASWTAVDFIQLALDLRHPLRRAVAAHEDRLDAGNTPPA